jgi:DNA polymerase elongation subunit (family B)
MAYDAKVNFNDVFFQVRTWDAIIYNYLKKRDIVIPPKDRSEKSDKFAGAYVKEPIPGKYDWIVSFDLTSLYPSLIMQYNISPETLLDEKYPGITVDKLLNKEIVIENIEGKCVSANGCMYDTTKRGIFPELVENIFNDRQFFKKEMLKEKSKLEEIENELKKRGIDLNTL